jgi:hypothetical protein
MMGMMKHAHDGIHGLLLRFSPETLDGLHGDLLALFLFLLLILFFC